MKKIFKFLILANLSCLLFAHAVFGDNAIVWDPQKILLSVAKGESKSLDVKFISGQNLRNVDLWLTPELQPYVKLTQNHFDSVTAGVVNNVQLIVSARCGDTIGNYDGTLHLRSSNATYPQTLKLSVNVIDSAISDTHIIDLPKIEPDHIYVNQSTPVTITIKIVPVPTLDFLNIHLFRMNSNNNVAADLGRLYDDGSHGDVLAGDSTFTTQMTLTETNPGPIGFQISVPYTDVACPVLSDLFLLYVKVFSDPDQVRTEIASELRSGDIVAAQKRFAPTAKNLILQTLNSESLNKLANAIENAELLKDAGSYKVYKTNWMDELGNMISLEFMMSQNDIGQWIIISW